MKPEPINAAKVALDALKLLDSGQRAVADGWKRLNDQLPNDEERRRNRRRPPQIW